MKKLLAVLCVALMLFSVSVTAFAEGFTMPQATSYDATCEYYTELNKPLDVIGCLAGFMFTDEMTEIDVQYLVESILKSKTTIDVKADVDTETLKQAKIEMKVNFNIPAHVSEDIKLNGDFTAYVWFDLDLRSEQDAKYIIIVKNPLNGKYLYFDLFDEEALGKEAVALMKQQLFAETVNIDAQAYMNEVTNLVNDAYLKNAAVTETADTVTLTYTNAALVDGIFDLLEGMFKLETLKQSMETAGMSIDTAQLAQMRALVKGLGIFSNEEASVITYKMDSMGNIRTVEEKLHLDFNIVELCKVFGLEEADLYPLEKSKADIDITFVAKAEYKKLNEEVEFTMPLLTEENSISLVELMMPVVEEGYYEEDYYEEDYTYVPEYFYDWAMGEMRRSIYACVDDFKSSAQWDDDNFKVEHKIIMVDGKEKIQLAFSSDYLPPVVIVGDTEHNEYTINGVKVHSGAGAPFMYVEGYDWETYDKMDILYVNTNVLAEAIDCKVESATMYYVDYETGEELEMPEIELCLYRKNPAYKGE